MSNILRPKINIDLDKILDIGLKGVRRAYVFMGFGINSANDSNFRDFHLPVESIYRLLPDEVSVEQLKEFKDAYYHWSVSCALRELIENYEVFLENIFGAVYIIDKHTKEEFNEQTYVSSVQSFQKKNFPEKLEILQEKYKVTIPFSDSILSIKNARNCIGHRLGRVRKRDLNKEDKMVVTWRGFDFFVETESGARTDLIQQGQLVNKEGVVLTEGGNLMMKTSNRLKEFNLEQVVLFQPAELHEMGLSFVQSIRQTVASVLELANAAGIQNESEKKNL